MTDHKQFLRDLGQKSIDEAETKDNYQTFNSTCLSSTDLQISLLFVTKHVEIISVQTFFCFPYFHVLSRSLFHPKILIIWNQTLADICTACRDYTFMPSTFLIEMQASTSKCSYE